MKDKKQEYIDFDEFVSKTGLKKATIIRNYKRIPGLEKTDNGFRVLSGTRYFFPHIGRYKLDDAFKKRYVLLKAISMYRYIGHKELRIEKKQFEQMLNDLLSAGLIRPNNLSNNYGANAYDSTLLGDEVLQKKESASMREIINLIAEAAGNYTGAVISQVYDMVQV